MKLPAVNRKLLFRTILVLVALVVGLVIFCDARVVKAAKGKTFENLSLLPKQKVGLLLGTGKYLSNGYINLYYKYRIDAAIQLMKAGKIEYLVISGDNSRPGYDEPSTMRADLVASGIDSTRIYLDYAGFRTFDSMVRFRDIFSQDSVTIISQEFHNERALYIAGREHLHAIAYNARDVSKHAGIKTKLREKLARVKVFADYLFGQQPRFGGPKVPMP